VLTIRPATASDTRLILELIKELASYEKLAHEVVADESTLHASLFSENSNAHALIAEEDSKPIGFALYFYNFSTFLGRKGLYLEDLYIRPDYRGRGYGRQVLRYLAKQAVVENCGRMEWWVLDWNEPSIHFYKSLGAVPMDEWTVFRLDEEKLKALAISDET
jgi:GNAT superfamily N-acetyltransferase